MTKITYNNLTTGQQEQIKETYAGSPGRTKT